MNTRLVHEVLQAIDRQPREVTDWEAGFLESLLKQGYPPTERQLRVVVRLAETYLAPEYAAELRGQQRLFPLENAHG
jgi:hypothetical protein